MIYKNIIEGIFISRPNRFIAKVLIDGREETVHVKNTGRCKELLVQGTTVYLEVSDNPDRKTKYDLVAVLKNGEKLINMDSQVVNSIASDWLKKGNIFTENAVIRREVTYGNSRFDIFVEDGQRKAFVEVKGVTLEENGEVRFPDAPTARGVKHINELIKCIDDGYEAYILFVIQMKGVSYFTPNDLTHKEFGDTLRRASKKGVRIIAVDCIISSDSIEIDSEVEVRL
ncbi:MAG: DNA/RNA nuclease SfsA [Clostridia bacterium]|nr:DNA/RNA nuclease SfsA [Clostridia bacterium]